MKTRMCYDATRTSSTRTTTRSPRKALSFQDSPTTDGGPAAQDKKAAIRQAVFNQLNTELTGLQKRMCSEDATRLGSIQAAWNGLDQQFAAIKAAVAACPARPVALSSPVDFPTAAKAQMDLAVLAMQCDLTRVVTLQFSTATSNVTHKWIDPMDSASHHQHSHSGPGSLYALGTNLYDPTTYNPPGDPDTGVRTRSSRRLTPSMRIKSRISRRSSITRACSASRSSAGGASSIKARRTTTTTRPSSSSAARAARSRRGKLVQFPLNLPNNADPTGNRFHNDLLITLAQAMGVNLTAFGTPSGSPSRYMGKTVTFSTGPIAQILSG